MRRLILMLGLWSSIHASLAQDESESLAGVWKGDLSRDVACALMGCVFGQSSVSHFAFELEVSADGRASIQQPFSAKDLIVLDLGRNAIVLGRRPPSTDSRPALTISLNLSRIDENTLFVYFYSIETSDSSDTPVPYRMQGGTRSLRVTSSMLGGHGVLTLERSD